MGAFTGILVADFSRVLAGPLATMTLADLGAEVVKVESPSGDDTRRWGPPFRDGGRTTYHDTANRNKRSIVLDLKNAGDLALARRLCERADVVVGNFHPGTFERMGLGYADVSAVNPGVIYAEVSGFGEDAGKDLPGYDPLLQAMSGLMSITGPPGEPSKAGVALIDVLAGLWLALGITGALHERTRSGLGQRVTVNLMHTALAALANQSTGWLGAGDLPRSLGNDHPSVAPAATYATGDGLLMICVGNDRQFATLVRVIGRPELADDPRFRTNPDRVTHKDELRSCLEELLVARTAVEWGEALLPAGVPAGPVQDLAQAFAYADSLGLDVVAEVAGVKTVAQPARLSRTPATARLAPPDLGEHSDELRAWLSA